MKRSIKVVTIPISRKGELSFFQVSLPRDISRIVGIQAGIMGIENVSEMGDRYEAGTVKVQAENIADMCFCTTLFVGRASWENKLPGFENASKDLLDLFTAPDVGSGLHPLLIRNSYTLYCRYEDALIKALNQSMSYTVRLYIWTETDEPKNEKL